jgi:holo-[acyl-carrier protein] synthase
MAFNVGIDIVTREEVEAALRTHGERYLQRVYSEAERQDAGGDALRLAARFAVKEATMKALAPGDDPLPWKEIAVGRDRHGRPQIHLTGAADRLARERNVNDLAVSLSHEGDLAVAVVLAS